MDDNMLIERIRPYISDPAEWTLLRQDIREALTNRYSIEDFKTAILSAMVATNQPKAWCEAIISQLPTPPKKTDV